MFNITWREHNLTYQNGFLNVAVKMDRKRNQKGTDDFSDPLSFEMEEMK